MKVFSFKKTGMIVAFFALFFSKETMAQLKAFPGAEGAGALTTGGRGTAAIATTVFEVTNLGDLNSPGSLRYALSATAAYRTIVFRISGTIHLTSKLTIKANTTIAGQTAPGGGICLADYPVVISGDNVVMRYIRCRMGDKNQNKGKVDGSGGDDALGNLGNKNIIIDHCSISWSSDEALTVYRGDSVTLQWNIISEPLNYSYHFEAGDTDYQQHGYGGIWGGRKASFHHNLIAHCKNRMPRFSGAYNGIADTCDFRNNVIFDWGINNVYGGEGGFYNIVNNYYKRGPNNTSRPYQFVGVDYSTTAPPHNYAKYYLTGNYMTGSSINTASNWKGVTMKSGLMSDTVFSKVLVPFSLPALVSETNASQAYLDVLAGAGAILPERDTLDQRIINDVKNNTGKIIDVQGGYPHGTPYAQTVNAWPTLVSTTPPTDTDHDGMPDTYETANGLNPNNAADRNNRNAEGYTLLEVYLNSIVANIVSAPVQTSATATWSLLTDQTAVTTGSVLATNQALGSAIAGTSYGTTFGATAPATGSSSIHNQNYQRAASSTYLPTISPSTSIVPNAYVEYTISPESGKDLKITDISLAIVGGGSSAVRVVARYSLDGFATANNISTPSNLANYNTTLYNASNATGYAATETDPVILLNGSSSAGDFKGSEILSFNNLAIMVPNGKTCSVRIYAYVAATSGNRYLAEKDVIITGVTGDAGTLPLNFLSFTGKADEFGKAVNLNWSTTNEVNTKNFEIQKRTNNSEFSTIGTLNSKNTNGIHHYFFVDRNASCELAYYRILQSDYDGKSKYSAVISVKNNTSDALIVYPNPVTTKLNLTHPITKEGAHLKIINLTGALILKKELQKGIQNSELEVGGLKAGTYILVFSNVDKTLSLTFMK